MLLIFDGPQRAGKTTLINQLLTEFSIPLWKRPAETLDYVKKTDDRLPFILDEVSILETIDWHSTSMIVDRYPLISEWVYSSVFSRRQTFSIGVILSHMPAGAALIYVERNPELTGPAGEGQYDKYEYVFEELAKHVDIVSVPFVDGPANRLAVLVEKLNEVHDFERRLAVENYVKRITDEYYRTTYKYGPFNSYHEGLGVLLEEKKELEDAIFLKPGSIDQSGRQRKRAVIDESIQIASVALRMILDGKERTTYEDSKNERDNH